MPGCLQGGVVRPHHEAAPASSRAHPLREELDNVCVATHDGPDHGHPALHVLHVHPRLLLHHEHAHHVRLARHAREVQRSLAVRVLLVDVRAGLQDLLDLCIALHVCQSSVGTGGGAASVAC